MIWILIIALFFLFICWLLLSPIELEIDTRVPVAVLRWRSLGKAMMIYEKEDWQLELNILFFHRKWSLEKLIFAERKQKKRTVEIKKKKIPKNILPRLFRLLKSFRITKCLIAIDSEDYLKNAWLYPLNFAPFTRHHLFINYMDDNYLLLIIKNSPWRILYTWLKLV